MTDLEILKSEERAVLSLRSLYKQHGYLSFKMNKFEEYDFYARNKDFLIGDSVITFNDTDGRLLALKPDVTLSIIKKAVDKKGCKEKLCYNENVYRISERTHRFKEIMQSGLECIGDIDTYDIYEVTYLGAKSLSLISEDFVMDISHMGIITAIVESVSSDEGFKKSILTFIANKNRHEAKALIEEYGIPEEKAKVLLSLVDMHGDMQSVLAKLMPLCLTGELKEQYEKLYTVCSLLMKTELSDRIKIDFSVISDINYYNGIVFRGFLRGISESVLSGGEYGMLMKKMGRQGTAIGFALYLDLLDGLRLGTTEYDVDVLLVYGDNTEKEKLVKMKDEIIKGGESVSLQRAIPDKLRYKRIVRAD